MVAGLIVEPLTAARAPALVALFAREGSPCHCRYWHFPGTNKEWEARCALEPEENARALLGAAGAGSVEAQGIVACRGDDVVGWLKVAPRAALPKLTGRLPYRDLDDPGGVLSLGCFLVDPTVRRAGVAGALLDGALAHGAAFGGRFLEAYPRVSDAPLHDGEAWQGPLALFVSRGFSVVREAPQYPVLRRAIAGGQSVSPLA